MDNIWTGLLRQCGICLYSGGEPVPLTYQEIDAWSRVARIEVAGYEAEMMRLLSQHYVVSWRRALDPACPDPCKNVQDVAVEAFKALAKRFGA